jgi:hypothetical protein
MELIFEVRDAEEGGYFARALGHAIFTQADTWDDLRANVLEATSLHFENNDPIVEEVRLVREKLAAKHGFDIEAILTASKKRQARSKHTA